MGQKTPEYELCPWSAEGDEGRIGREGVNTHGMNADQMHEVLSSHADFRIEKSRIERFLMKDKEHIVYMLPKFHCELNPIDIERVWAQTKRYSKVYCNYSIGGLRNTIHPALD